MKRKTSLTVSLNGFSTTELLKMDYFQQPGQADELVESNSIPQLVKKECPKSASAFGALSCPSINVFLYCL